MSLNECCYEYFINTPTDKWDALQYHETWKASGFPLNKATVTRTFKQQVDWILTQGSSAQKERAAVMKAEFKSDTQEGGRIFAFWERIMQATKLSDIEKETAVKIRKLQAQHHLTVANRMLEGEGSNVVTYAGDRGRKRRYDEGPLASQNKDVLLEENPLISTIPQNTKDPALWISDNDDDATVELCLPKEEHMQTSEKNEIDTGLAGQDWRNWTTLLQKARKNSQHKQCAENFNIIQCGGGISRSAYMSKKIYESLQAALPKVDRTPFIDYEAYIIAALQMTSLEGMQQSMLSNKPSVDKLSVNKFQFVYRLLDQFAQHVFKSGKKISQMKSSEVCYNHLALWPCLYAAVHGLTTSTFGDVEFSPGEIDLVAVAKVRMLRKQSELQHKADGVVHTEESHMELLFLETTGHHGLSDRPRVGWDHVKGMNGVLAMLARIAYAFPYGSIEAFKDVNVAFIHAHGVDLHFWTVSMPSPGIYVMQRISKTVVPASFLEKHHLASLINFFWMIRMELLKTIDKLETLKATHVENELAIRLRGQRSGTYLPDLLKPVANTLNKKTDYAGVGEVNPDSSPLREYD